MCNQYRGKLFVLDDESYFGLSLSHVPWNTVFYTSDVSSIPADVKYKFQQKFEPQIMLYIPISERGISKPWFKSNGIAINKEVYINEC